jgi:hypothetical protein
MDASSWMVGQYADEAFYLYGGGPYPSHWKTRRFKRKNNVIRRRGPK